MVLFHTDTIDLPKHWHFKVQMSLSCLLQAFLTLQLLVSEVKEGVRGT